MKGLVAYTHNQDVQVVPKGTDDPGLYMYRLMFLEYMADYTNDRSKEGLETLAEVIGVPYAQLSKWKSSTSFQHLLARRAKDKSLGGTGLATAYEVLNQIISTPGIDIATRRKAATDLAKLSLKQDEMYLRYKMSKDKGKQPSSKKTFEEEVIDAEWTEIT